jgi:hypothetical protein
MIDKSRVVWRARNTALTALIVFLGMLALVALRAPFNRDSGTARHFNWTAALALSSIFALAYFLLFFLWGILSDIRAQPTFDILAEETPEANLLKSTLYGFVAMEFYWLILNRTYLVFAATDGLYGWKATGPVTNSNRRYFEPFQKMFENQEFMRDLPVIRKLSGLSGGFFYPPSQIALVSSDERSQWGMGDIAHSGHVHVRLASGESRKLIVLGEVIPEEARDRIVAALGAGITSAK